MIRVMFDSDNPADLPRGAMGATYSDLFVSAAELARLRGEFPAGLLLIDRHGDPLGQAVILDVETGLHKPSDAPGWFDRRMAEGATGLTIYCNRSNLAAVTAAMGDRGWFRWVATLDGTAHIAGFPPGLAPAAVQILGEAKLGFHADMSVVWEPGWHSAEGWRAASRREALDIAAAAAELAVLLGAHQ